MKKYDLIVVGGGLAGVGAAVAGARQGLSVMLVEKSNNLGGALTNSLVYPFCPYRAINPEKKTDKLLSGGIFTEMRERYAEKTGSKVDRNFDTEYFKFVLDDIVTDAGVEVLFHATVYGVSTNERKVSSVQVATKAGNMEFEADFFVDTSGDGDLFYLAGCDYLLGREEDNLCQPMTTCFRLCGVDLDKYVDELPRLQELYKEYRALGKITNPRENLLIFDGVGDGILHFNTTRIVRMDPTNPFDISIAEIEARKQICEVVDLLRNNSEAFKNCMISSVATQIGVRESRKLKGEHILTVEELFDRVMFDDSIALGNYDVDIHNPAGTGTVMIKFDRRYYYSIPYRSLLPKEFDNLLVAGRCISATHEAQSSVRIMPICACLGEAAGTAIGLAKNTGLNTHTIDIKALQKLLTDNGAQIY
jgi:hypothetical protein